MNSFDFRRYEDTIKLADDPDYNQANFEGMLEIKGDSDHTKLIEMTRGAQRRYAKDRRCARHLL